MTDIATTLAGLNRAGTFAVRGSLPADALRLEVRSVGPVALPVSAAQARQLCAVARPARYGLRDRTLLDPRVRDTWEVARSRVRIDRRRWHDVIRPELDRIRRELGLAEGCELKAELHNLLIYAPGQFFAPHQDTEKTDGMIGSLVVTLPSDFQGGALVVEHGAQRLISRGSAKQLSLLAFYADCQHAVRPVREGYRVVLTYNLILEGEAGLSVPEQVLNALTEQLRRFFETPRPPKWRGDTPGPPPYRLVYLLDHQYTAKSLGWARLKNADALRARALEAAASRLDGEVFLALADVHELWSCEDERYGFGPYRDFYDDNDDDDEDEGRAAFSGDDHPPLTELVDDDVELRHFVGAGAALPSATSRVSPGELCYTRPSADFEPFQFEHERYTGNAGNTVDRWYHRAAVVVWPRERGFAVRASASATWAAGTMRQALRTGSAPAARRMAEQVLPFWAATVRAERSAGLLHQVLEIATGVGDAALAQRLLEPFALEQLSPKSAARFVALLEGYGAAWCRALLAGWAPERVDHARQTWLRSLPKLLRAIADRGGDEGRALARWLVAAHWRAMEAGARRAVRNVQPSQLSGLLAQSHRSVLALLESARLLGDSDLHADMLRALADAAVRGPILNLVHLLHDTHASHSGQPLRELALGPLARHCHDELRALLARPPRADGDWSMQLPADCSCDLCLTLRRFLEAPKRTRLEWPLAKDNRMHVHRVIDRHELDVTHVTRRTGRPFTLVLEKTAAMVRREAAERAAWQRELEWLEANREAFG